jgi:exosome complex RNA-binding protein Rrp42 (RNase PH superfamily)
VIREGNLGKLKTSGIATSCTFGKIGSSILLDPSESEEREMSTRLTVATDETCIRAMQKGLKGSLTADEIHRMIDETFEKSKQLRDTVKKAIGD